MKWIWSRELEMKLDALTQKRFFLTLRIAVKNQEYEGEYFFYTSPFSYLLIAQTPVLF